MTCEGTYSGLEGSQAVKTVTTQYVQGDKHWRNKPSAHSTGWNHRFPYINVNRTWHSGRTGLQSPLPNKGAIGHRRPWAIYGKCNQVLYFKFYLILSNINVNCNMWLVSLKMGITAEDTDTHVELSLVDCVGVLKHILGVYSCVIGVFGLKCIRMNFWSQRDSSVGKSACHL